MLKIIENTTYLVKNQCDCFFELVINNIKIYGGLFIMGIFYDNKSSNYSFTQGQVAIQQLRANPNSVPLCLENGNYYLASTDLERFMECSNTYDVDEAIEQVAEANNISSY